MQNVDSTTRGFLNKPPGSLRYAVGTAKPSEPHALIAQLIPQGASVLDVGCGVGDLCIVLRKLRGAEVMGLEPHVERAAEARKHGLTIECGELDRSVASRCGKFDVVVFADVLEHLVDPVSVLEISHQVLRPEGRIVASIPNIAHWSVRLKLLFGHFDYEECGLLDATHLRWFTQKTVERVFAAAGFRISSIKRTPGAWMPVYKRHPFRWLSSNMRCRMIRLGIRVAPNLLGCQFIVEAVPAYQPPKLKMVQ